MADKERPNDDAFPDGNDPGRGDGPRFDEQPVDGRHNRQIPPVGERPRKSLKDRLLSNRSARFIGAGVPLSMVPTDENVGRLVEAVEEFGWQISDSDDEADEMLKTLPVPIHGYRAGNVVHGRFDPFTNRAADGLAPGEWKFVAFDAVEDSRIGRTVRQCFTAVPTMLPLPDLRVVPSRFRLGSTRGMVVYPTVDPIFDARWKLLAANGEEELLTLSTLIDDDVRSQLCAGLDSEELWARSSHILITTAGPHDENVLARHLQILGAMLRALRTSSMND